MYTLSKCVQMWDNAYPVGTGANGAEQVFTQHILSHVFPSTTPIILYFLNGNEQQTALHHHKMPH